MSHQYRNLPADMMDEHLSNFLIDRWSYSKVNTFARNEKAFEMSYIYMEPYKKSASSVAGSAYHVALQYFFDEYSKGTEPDIVSLEEIAFEYIKNVEPKEWKTQKTTPTVESCIEKSTKKTVSLLKNFYHEKSIYIDYIKEVLAVEQAYTEFLTINGVDIPLPCKGIIDLIIVTKNNKKVIIDHKSKVKYTDEKEIKLSVGKQSITYYNLYKESTGVEVDEVWFIENKSSTNRDKSPQLVCHKVELSTDTIRLYEAMLYEPLKRMIEAVSDPDYVYLINENDNMVDKAEIYEFWARTLIAESDDFNIPDNKKEMISKRLKKIRNSSLNAINPKVVRNFKKNAAAFITYDLTNKNMTRENKIEHILRSLGIIVNVAHTFKGFSSDTFLIEVSAGTNISSISRYKLDIASALSVSSVRMYSELFIHEGKSYVAVEAAKKREKFLIFNKNLRDGLKIPIGIDNFNNVIRWDMENPSTPHVLIGGATGSGKSVSLISIIEYAKLSGINIIILDPKYEFLSYNHETNIEVYNEIDDIETTMELMVEEMNTLVKAGRKSKTMIVFDEFADALANSRRGKLLNVYKNVPVGEYADGREKTKREIVEVKKSLEENLRLLLQKGRSIGFNIVAATQRASVKVITGDTKANFGVIISFRLPKEVDSKVMLDEPGAESLAGKGDGLIKSPEYINTIRFQSFYKEPEGVTV